MKLLFGKSFPSALAAVFFLGALALFLRVQSVRAQPSKTPESETESNEDGDKASTKDEKEEASTNKKKASTNDGKPKATKSVSKEVLLSPSAMRSNAETQIANMQNVLVRVVELQQLARKQKDVIKLNCVNDKLLQVKQLLNIAESSRTDLVEAIAQRDNETSQHQFSEISIANEKTGALRNEAEGCIGEELIFLGPTQVEMDAPNVPFDPTADYVFKWYDVLEAPAFASPFI